MCSVRYAEYHLFFSNVTILKLVIILNIYTNPECNPKAKLGEHCPKVRLSQDRMPIEPLTQQKSWVRGKSLFCLPQLGLGRVERPFPPPLA